MEGEAQTLGGVGELEFPPLSPLPPRATGLGIGAKARGHKYVKHLTSSCCFRRGGGGRLSGIVTEPGGHVSWGAFEVNIYSHLDLRYGKFAELSHHQNLSTG